MKKSVPFPTISIVTPSFNQGRFLGDCLKSIASQNYPALEHIVIDGGSTDDSLSVVEAHRSGLAYVVSEADDGQYDAINRGFARSTGEVMAWLNADDLYFPWSLRLIGEIFANFPQVAWLTTLHPFAVDAGGVAIKMTSAYGFDRKGFLNGNNLVGAGWPGVCFIQQEGTFWRRSLWDKAGATIDSSLHYAGDFDLWARFFEHEKLFGVELPLGIYRRQPDQKTAHGLGSYVEEAKASLRKHGGREPRPAAQMVRLSGRKFDWSRKMLLRLGQIEPAPVVSYNWGTEAWELVER